MLDFVSYKTSGAAVLRLQADWLRASLGVTMFSISSIFAVSEAGAAVADVFVEAEKTKFEIVSEGIVGFFIVILILAILSSLISALSLFFREKPKAAAQPVAAPAASEISEAHAKVVAAAALHTALRDGVDNPHLPVILAAAAQAVAAPQNLQLPETGTGWSLEGRRGIFGSHTPKKN